MRFGKDFGGLAAGTTIGGLCIGLGEALYRDVPRVYAALLYGTGWGCAGIVLALLWGLLRWRKNKPPRQPFLRGLMLSLALSIVVLVRFIVLRDVFLEAPDKAWLALGIGVGSALAVILFLTVVTRIIERRIAAESLVGMWLWFVPLCVTFIFAVRTHVGDEIVAETPPQAPSTTTSGRGVILVVVDALRADAIGCLGAEPHRGKPATPRLDQFAKGARIYTRASAQASWTRPAVASIFTSRHPSGHDTMSKNAVLPATLPTIATVLADAQIRSSAVVTNYNLEPAYGFARGFADYFYLAPARYLGAPREAYRLAAYETYRLLRERYVTFDREPRYFYRSGAAVTTQALNVLDATPDQANFFLYLHYMEAHDPYFAVTGESYARVSNPKPAVAMADEMRDAYRDGVRRFDDYFGMLLDGLAARHLDERTTIIVVADHGEEFADHGGFYHGLTLYEEMLHVPLLIAGPGIAAGNDDRLVRQIDIAPTVVGRLGAKAPTSWEGRDIYASSDHASVSVAEENHEGNVLRAIRSGNDKLIMANPDNPRGLKPTELYDLAKDPREKYLIHTEATVTRLQVLLENVLSHAGRDAGHAATHNRDAAGEAELRALGYVQ